MGKYTASAVTLAVTLLVLIALADGAPATRFSRICQVDDFQSCVTDCATALSTCLMGCGSQGTQMPMCMSGCVGTVMSCSFQCMKAAPGQ